MALEVLSEVGSRPHTMAIGVALSATDGCAMAIPEAALVTDTAGRKMPSAIIKEVPKRHWEVECT